MMRRVSWLKWVAYTLCVIILTVIQSQAGFFPKWLEASPLLAVAAVIALAAFEGETAGGIFGIAAGLIWDCGTGRVFGFNALFLMVIGIATGLLVRYLFHRGPFTVVLFTVFFTLTHEFVTWFFFYYMTGMRDLKYTFLNIMLPTAVLTMLFAVPFFFGARAINRRLTQSDGA